MKIELHTITPNAEALIEHAGRVCSRTDLSPTSAGRAAFIKELIRKEHWSVLEHPCATFDIEGISRSCSHQLVRHRLSSFSQESMRYVDMTDQVAVIPPAIVTDEGAKFIWADFLHRSWTTYQNLRALGIRKEDARFVLPIATTTRLVMTENFRSWRHFIELRCDKHAQWEIRKVATTILDVLYREAPAVFGDLHETYLG